MPALVDKLAGAGIYGDATQTPFRGEEDQRTMKADQLVQLTIAEAARSFQSGELSPVELTRACLERIEAMDPKLNAFITLLPELAMAEARAAEQRLGRGERLGSLDGIPFAIKDLYETKGIRTTAGSKILADYVPAEDATCIRRLREQGVVLLGKLNMHEWAFGATNVVSHFGPAHNPWGLDRITGGSSGGSGAALAASLCLGSLGSDTGGSIRMPASMCGIVGLKPTYGRVSKHGVVPLSGSLDHAGPMTRTVEDAALVLQAIAGPDPDDLTTEDVPVPDYPAALSGEVRGLRVGVPGGDALSGLDKDVETSFRATLKTLESLGASLVEVHIPALQRAEAIWEAIAGPEAAAYHRRNLEERPEDFSEPVRLRLQQGLQIRAVDYLRGLEGLQQLRAEVAQQYAKIDVLVTPTTASTASRIEDELAASGREVHIHRLTCPFNLTGQPAISVPCGFDSQGLPVGLQIVGRAFDEETVLRVAHAYEQATDWHKARPNL
ncbi:MAG: aspartyl/glutamyl-tRNA amidotransferase subunit A [Dehalococcoidia bacterium]|nr:aspartyl/glutamyl-tRNA amidotransferase subunit A [Dehalococcoidia bacterium]